MATMVAEYNKWFRHQGMHVGTALAVLTSGGDSQGMNAALRAVVRVGIFVGCKVFFVHEGFEGLIAGGEMIELARWDSVTSIIHRGGTFIGSSRCDEFRTEQGMLKAATNMIQRGITKLVVIGGDGSLTGASEFQKVWPSLNQILFDRGCIESMYPSLQVVGIVASIDNDFNGTDMTIGANSALQRITEAFDSVVDTATSHQRTFIMEVMGRQCGHLALVTCLVCEADYFFIPESPPPKNWPDKLCDKLTQERSQGKRLNLIVISEGATDLDGNPIKPEQVKQIVVDRLHHDARITVLGHVQRGGHPSAYDRVLAARMGAEAVLTLLSTPNEESLVIVVQNQELVRLPLTDAVAKTRAVGSALQNKEWGVATMLRGESFKRTLAICKTLAGNPPIIDPDLATKQRVLVLHIGKPACGMNGVLNAFVKVCTSYDIVVVAAEESIDGLIANKLRILKWSDVIGWITLGGSVLGTHVCSVDDKFNQIAQSLRRNNIHGILFVGGFDAYNAVLQLYKARRIYAEFRIPMLVVPVTINNNVPGTDITIGSDTSLNEITDVCDRIRQSAQGTKHRVFLIETMGAFCGYLASMAAITSGADISYIFEEKYDMESMNRDVKHIIAKTQHTERALIFTNQNASENYNTDFLHQVFSEGGKGIFTCRKNILGHFQQGGTPSPRDRAMSVKTGVRAAEFFQNILTDAASSGLRPETACVCGRINGTYCVTPVLELECNVDFEHRLPKDPKWMKLRCLMKILSKHESAFHNKTFSLFGTKYNICLR